MPARVAAGAPHGSWKGCWGGEGGPQQGDGKRGPPVFPAGLAWLESSVVDLVFTKYKAACLEPLSQALGPLPGVRSPTVPVPGWGLGWAHGHSGPSWAEWQGACSSLGGLPSLPGRNTDAQAQRRPGTLEKRLCRVGAPHRGSSERLSKIQGSCFVPLLSKLGLTDVLTRKSLLS